MIRKNEHMSVVNFFRHTLRALFSHLGLLFLVIIFTIGGGLIFQLLETHASRQKCEEGEGKHRTIVKKLASTIFDYVWLNATNLHLYQNLQKSANTKWLNELINREKEFLKNYNKDIPEILIEYRKSIIDIYNNYKYSGQNCIQDTSWILESSLLFTISVLTTIGYGHITPITWEGMVVCICFAMIGIPLCLLCVSKLSRDLANIFRVVYARFIKLLFGKCLTPKKNPKSKSFKPKLNLEIISRFNDSYDLNFIKNSIESESDSDSEDSYLENEQHRITVPLFVIMIIICLYVMAGSYLFQFLEGWTSVTSSYFSFITMATIGFGDVVPGIKDLGKIESRHKINRNLIIAAVYLFVGIAILAMCFDLLQETFIIKIVKFSRRVKSNVSELKKIEYRIKKIRPYLMNKKLPLNKVKPFN
ncbi:unnamed protein product [Brachionus calyciflorus]|uniref:Potassium channel domain-containing protein n=1 Tax=Brachionus calyciflorus TaxID=104777 RepID=A0A813S1B3_9BILA|nr:unnamed protein product [Brachionus calyciflorus]